MVLREYVDEIEAPHPAALTFMREFAGRHEHALRGALTERNAERVIRSAADDVAKQLHGMEAGACTRPLFSST
jgi:hypothetical protein